MFFGKKHFLARKFLGKHFFCPNKKIAKKNLQFFFAICWQKKCYSQQNNFGQHFCQGKQIYLAKVSVKISFWPNVSVDKKNIGQKKKCWPTNLVWPKFSLTKKKFVHKKKFVTKICLANIFFGPNKFLWPTKFVLPMLLLGVSFTTPLSLVRARKICSEIGSHFNSIQDSTKVL